MVNRGILVLVLVLCAVISAGVQFAGATTGADLLATGQLATINTMEPRHQLVTLMTDR